MTLPFLIWEICFDLQILTQLIEKLIEPWVLMLIQSRLH